MTHLRTLIQETSFPSCFLLMQIPSPFSIWPLSISSAPWKLYSQCEATRPWSKKIANMLYRLDFITSFLFAQLVYKVILRHRPGLVVWVLLELPCGSVMERLSLINAPELGKFFPDATEKVHRNPDNKPFNSRVDRDKQGANRLVIQVLMACHFFKVKSSSHPPKQGLACK